MFRLGWKGKEATFRPVTTHNAAIRARLADYSFRTLGNGDFNGAVKLPPNEDIHEWYATNSKY